MNDKLKWVIECFLVSVLPAIYPLAAHAAITARDIESLQQAVEGYIQSTTVSSQYPDDFRNLVLLPSKGGDFALIFAKPASADCAALALARQAICRAFLMRKVGPNSWSMAFTFEHKIFPVAVTVQNGEISSIWVNSSLDSADRYRKVSLTTGNAALAAGEFSLADVNRLAHWEFDDRNSPLMSVVYRMSGASSAPPLLSPARALSDTVNSNSRLLDRLTNLLVTPGATKVQALEALKAHEVELTETLTRRLQADLDSLAQRVTWPQVLDTRVRRCTDWMVPRAFWLTESRRLASPGVCTDVIFWGQETGRLKSNGQALALARLYFFDDIGAAHASRVLGITLEERSAWLTLSRLPQFMSLSAGLGAMLAARSGTQSFVEREAAYRLDESLAHEWFQDVEANRGYVSPTPELNRYNEYRSLRRAGLACAKSVASGQRGGCDADVARLLQLAHKEIFN